MNSIKLLGVLGFLFIALGDLVPVINHTLPLVGFILILILTYKISAHYPRYKLFQRTLMAIFLQFLSLILLVVSIISMVRANSLIISSILIYILGQVFLIISGYLWRQVFTIFFILFNIDLMALAGRLIFISYSVLTIVDIFIVSFLFLFSIEIDILFLILGVIVLLLYGARYILSKIAFAVASYSFYMIKEENYGILNFKHFKVL